MEVGRFLAASAMLRPMAGTPSRPDALGSMRPMVGLKRRPALVSIPEMIDDDSLPPPPVCCSTR